MLWLQRLRGILFLVHAIFKFIKLHLDFEKIQNGLKYSEYQSFGYSGSFWENLLKGTMFTLLGLSDFSDATGAVVKDLFGKFPLHYRVLFFGTWSILQDLMLNNVVHHFDYGIPWL